MQSEIHHRNLTCGSGVYTDNKIIRRDGMFKLILCCTVVVGMLTACGVKTEPSKVVTKNVSNAEIDFEDHVAFEHKYLPIVEKAIREIFSDVSMFEKFGVYYISDSEKILKIVFLLDQPNSKEVKKLKTVLEAKMGDYVEFRVSKHPQEKLNNIQNEITNTLNGMKLRGGWSVSSDIMKQKVVVEAHLTEEQRSQLMNQYGADLVEVKISGVVTAMVGYVVREKDGKILVVDPNVQDYGAQGGESFHYAASWYSNVPLDVKVGQKIEVKVIEGPTTSQYPGDSSAENVIIIPSIIPENAKLLEEEAIRKALASNEYQQSIAAADGWLPVIKEAKYNEMQNIWTVDFTNESTDQVVSIHVEDKP